MHNDFDPLIKVNRGTEALNNTIDNISLKPIAKGYQAVTSKDVRSIISNFYDNATYLNTVLNGFLQGKTKQGFEDFARFIINSSIGVVGLADVASSLGFEKHNEDFGQTLATWGVDRGAYIVYPFLGPNSMRNTPGFITATATDPLFWLSLAAVPQITIPLTALKYIDRRSQLLEASDMRDEMALDPYLFTREAWRQLRDYQIYDGNPPTSSTDDFENEDDWGDNLDNEEDWADEDTSEEVKLQMSNIAEPEKSTSPVEERPRFRPRIRMGN
ncbi:MAG: VacJ family lipoprotein [Mariprofundaceae bacterium]|nr:VacJ family lipoprotein [Mariprofundaceae bacterium]